MILFIQFANHRFNSHDDQKQEEPMTEFHPTSPPPPLTVFFSQQSSLPPFPKVSAGKHHGNNSDERLTS